MTQPHVPATLNPLAPRPSRGQPRALLLGLCLFGACDETTAQKMLDASQAVENAGRPQVDPSPAVDASVAAYDRCYRECYTAHSLATNRETCKLECDSLAEDDLKTRADSRSHQEFPHLRGCLTGCWDRHDLSETNRETCLLTCDDETSIALTPAPKQRLEVVPGTVLTHGSDTPR